MCACAIFVARCFRNAVEDAILKGISSFRGGLRDHHRIRGEPLVLGQPGRPSRTGFQDDDGHQIVAVLQHVFPRPATQRVPL
jgi:hypothetical protein